MLSLLTRVERRGLIWRRGFLPTWLILMAVADEQLQFEEVRYERLKFE